MATIESRPLVTREGARKNFLPGARCANSKTEFKKRSPVAGIAWLRNSAGGNNSYPLCLTCGIAYNTRGNAGIPNCAAKLGFRLHVALNAPLPHARDEQLQRTATKKDIA